MRVYLLNEIQLHTEKFSLKQFVNPVAFDNYESAKEFMWHRLNEIEDKRGDVLTETRYEAMAQDNKGTTYMLYITDSFVN